MLLAVLCVRDTILGVPDNCYTYSTKPQALSQLLARSPDFCQCSSTFSLNSNCPRVWPGICFYLHLWGGALEHQGFLFFIEFGGPRRVPHRSLNSEAL